MKPDTYTKTILSVIALLLALLVIKPVVIPEIAIAQGSTTAKNGASPSARWEYKIILRSRTFVIKAGADYGNAADWGFWAEDDKSLPLPVDVTAKLAQLGGQGWELVGIYPRSDKVAVSVDGKTGNGFGGAVLEGFALNGAATSDIWMFKRPKS